MQRQLSSLIRPEPGICWRILGFAIVCFGVMVGWSPSSLAETDLDLDELTDQELIDLYVVTYEETLRDSIVDQSSLVGPGRSVLQLGYSYTTQSDDRGLRYSTHTVPELLLRHRLTPRMEIRGGWSGVTNDRLVDKPTGFADSDSVVLNPYLGLRYRLWQQLGIRPQTSITASTPVDLGTNSGFLRRLNPQVAVGYSWLAGEKWLISGSTGAVWVRDLDGNGNEDRFLDLQQSLSFDWLISDQASLYLQWVALLPEGAQMADVSHSIGPGVSLPLTDRTQLDLTSAFGLQASAPDFGTQLFLSWRF